MSSCVAVNWLDHSRTFREQGVDENETLLLRRKFFYSDQNVDSRDPVQLNLLYVQVQYRMLRPWGWWAFQNSGCGWWRAATGLWFLPCLWRSLFNHVELCFRSPQVNPDRLIKKLPPIQNKARHGKFHLDPKKCPWAIKMCQHHESSYKVTQ